MASATGAPFDGFPSGIAQSSPPRRRANERESSVPHSAVDLDASVPVLRGQLHLPRRGRHRHEWATSPRCYRVWVGWRTASVSDNVVDLLALIDGRRSIRELAEALGNQQGRRVHPMEVAYLIYERLAPAGLIRLRRAQWESAPALPSLTQPAPQATAPLASPPAGAPATALLPSLAALDVNELVAVDALGTIRDDPDIAPPPLTPLTVPISTPAEPAIALAGDEAPTLILPRLPAGVLPAGEEVYVDEQPTMLLAPLGAPSAPTEPPGERVESAEPAEQDAQESPTTVVRPHQPPALATAELNLLEPVGVHATGAWSEVGQGLDRHVRLRERIGIAVAGIRPERSVRQALNSTQRAAVTAQASVQTGASAVAWPAGGRVRVRRLGKPLRIASVVVAGLVLLGLALTRAISTQLAHPSVVRHMASSTAVPPTPTPLQERILSGETAYIVRQGDTLASIASAHHISQAALLLVNGDILTGPNALAPGMRLAIPAIYQPALPASVQPRPLYYVVQGGDTLYMIGQRFGLDWRVIASFNHVSDPRTLATGQGLVIPPAGA